MTEGALSLASLAVVVLRGFGGCFGVVGLWGRVIGILGCLIKLSDIYLGDNFFRYENSIWLIS